MHNLVIQYGPQLRIASAILAAISFLFGAKGLGRFPALSKPGGFYSTIVMALPAGAFAAAVNYFFVTITDNLPLQLIYLVYHVQVNVETYIAIVTGLGIATTIAAPEVFRRPYDPTGGNLTVEDLSKGIVGPIGSIVLVVTQVVTYLIGAGSATYLIFDVLGWFPGYKPTIAILASTVVVIVALQFMRGVFLGQSVATHHITDVLTSNVKNDEDFDKMPDDVFQSALIAHLLAKRERTISNVILGLSYVFLLPISVANIALLVYLTRSIGWSVLIYVALVVVSWPIYRALRHLADGLSTKALLGIFAVPGLIAATIQFFLLNTSYLPNWP